MIEGVGLKILIKGFIIQRDDKKFLFGSQDLSKDQYVDMLLSLCTS